MAWDGHSAISYKGLCSSTLWYLPVGGACPGTHPSDPEAQTTVGESCRKCQGTGREREKGGREACLAGLGEVAGVRSCGQSFGTCSSCIGQLCGHWGVRPRGLACAIAALSTQWLNWLRCPSAAGERMKEAWLTALPCAWASAWSPCLAARLGLRRKALREDMAGRVYTSPDSH